MFIGDSHEETDLHLAQLMEGPDLNSQSSIHGEYGQVFLGFRSGQGVSPFVRCRLSITSNFLHRGNGYRTHPGRVCEFSRVYIVV